jgi:hypothetical protein
MIARSVQAVVRLSREIEVAYLPADPPRAGRVVFYRDDGRQPKHPGKTRKANVNTDGNPRVVKAVTSQPGEVVEQFAALTSASRSAKVWALATRKALELIARGLVVPGLDNARHGAWRFAGLTGADDAWIRQLVDAMPLAAFAVLDSRGRLPDPYQLVRAFMDGVADAWLRTAVGDADAGQAPFTAAESVDASAFGWAAQKFAVERDDGLGLALILDADGYYQKLSASWYDRREPARLVSVDEAGKDAPNLRQHLGWIGRKISWPALDVDSQRYWGQYEIYLDQKGIDFLFDRGGIAALAEHGVEVRLPAPLTRKLESSLILSESEDDADPREAFTLKRLPAFEWRASVDDRRLSDDELEQVIEAGSALVQLEDRLLLLDKVNRSQLRSRMDQPTPLEAIGAALTGAVRVADHDVPLTVSGPLAALRERLRAAGADRHVPQPRLLKGRLRDYQLRGLAWLTGLAELGFGGLLADDMGLGKTVTAIAFHLARQADEATAGTTLVVCPGTLMATWEAEIRRFAPSVQVRRFHGPTRTLSGVGTGAIVLTTYGTLRRDASRLASLQWGMVCADEAQHVKNATSSTAKALRSLKSGTRVALTGTPLENSVMDVWALLDWTTPGLLGTHKTFRSLYGRAAEHGDMATAARLGDLVRPFMLRRLKTDPQVAPELPARTVTDQRVTLSDEQAVLYRKVVEEEMDRVRGADGIERRGRVLAMLTRLKQVCNHPAQFHGGTDPAAGKSGKLELLDELLATITAEGQSTLVFTQYVAMGALLAAHLERGGITAAFIHGQDPLRRREQIVSGFQDGEHQVLVLSLKTAGTGLTLTRATHVVHYDRWWNPAVEDQASDRAHRIGQTRSVQIHRLICEGTLEERIAAMLDRKRDLADAVIGSGEAALTELTDEQLLDLIHLERR